MLNQAHADMQQVANQMQGININSGRSSLPNAAVENAISVAHAQQ